MGKEYRTVVITENGVANILFGESKLPLEKMEAIMNQYGRQGWKMVFQLVEARRYLLFFNREAVILTFERDTQNNLETTG